MLFLSFPVFVNGASIHLVAQTRNLRVILNSFTLLCQFCFLNINTPISFQHSCHHSSCSFAWSIAWPTTCIYSGFFLISTLHPGPSFKSIYLVMSFLCLDFSVNSFSSWDQDQSHGLPYCETISHCSPCLLFCHLGLLFISWTCLPPQDLFITCFLHMEWGPPSLLIFFRYLLNWYFKFKWRLTSPGRLWLFILSCIVWVFFVLFSFS